MNSRELTQTDKIVILVIGLVGALMFLPGIAFGLIIYAAANKLKAKKMAGLCSSWSNNSIYSFCCERL